MIWAILRGLLRALAGEFTPRGPKARPERAPKERPWWAETPESEARDASASSETSAQQPPVESATAPAWWGKPAPPATPPTIKVETDAGTFVASTTFSGSHAMGVARVERARQEGESRRHRRKATAGSVGPAEIELGVREPVVPVEPARPEAVPAVALASHDGAELRSHEPAVPEVASTAAPSVVSPGVAAEPEGSAIPIDPSEAPRVAQARRVRGRLAPVERPGSNLLATTLATRLALTASTSGSPTAERAAARKGDSA